MLVCVILLKYCIYLYTHYVQATKLCNREKCSLKMLRRTIKVFYIYKRKRAAWEVVQNRVNTCGVAYRKRAAWEVVQNRVNTCGVAYRTVDELKKKLGALKLGVVENPYQHPILRKWSSE